MVLCKLYLEQGVDACLVWVGYVHAPHVPSAVILFPPLPTTKFGERIGHFVVLGHFGWKKERWRWRRSGTMSSPVLVLVEDASSELLCSKSSPKNFTAHSRSARCYRISNVVVKQTLWENSGKYEIWGNEGLLNSSWRMTKSWKLSKKPRL